MNWRNTESRLRTTKAKNMNRSRRTGFDNFPRVVGAFYGQPWAIAEDKFREIEGILRNRIETGCGTDYQAATDSNRRRNFDEPFQRVEDVAVVYVRGTITQRPSIFSSGG